MDSAQHSPIVLSKYQTNPILKAYQEGKTTAPTSFDLGVSTSEAILTPSGLLLPTGECLDWNTIETISSDENTCFAVEDSEPIPIKAFSTLTGRAYSLYPTPSAPTMLVGGFPMHRIKDTDPYRDTLAKIRAAAPIQGCVLDTATGLGYTAIEAARTADEVITIELDPAAQEIARQNPWSRTLFTHPKIHRIIGDSCEEIENFDDESFSLILHDPPVLSLAGELYSLAFYRKAYRVLNRSGRMFHYIGNPHSKSGAATTKGVVRRLKEAGFGRIIPKPEAFGVLALK
ncbi:MAG TPA: RsmD family RNA methyltransferase [Anaerolineales bacterium]|nr:RsmD family RNA methyltransferase [Anaerolineales bacterium]